MQLNPPTPQTYRIDDSDPAIHYEADGPEVVWSFANQRNEGYNNTLHFIGKTGDAYMSFAFNGIAVSIYGYMNTSDKSLQATVQLNGVVFPISSQGEKEADQTPLFDSGHLGESDSLHNLTLTTSLQNDSILWIDFIEITALSQDDVASFATASLLEESKHKGLTPGLIAVIVLGCTICVGLLALAGILWHRRQLKKPQHSISSREFEILPSEGRTAEKSLFDVLYRFKMLGQRPRRAHRGQPRSEGTGTESTLFTSVIMPPASLPSSR